MSDKPEHNKLDSDCTLPPDHPLPADQLGRYSPARDYYAEKDIADYVTSQARDETIQNVERVKTEPGARTALFVPELRRLFVAVPRRGAKQAEVLVFETKHPG